MRVARELHDEVGQTLTGVVLALEGIHRRAPEGLEADIADVQEAARAGVEQVREIARGLRPGPLEELGLRSALTTLATRFGDRAGLRVRHSLASDLPALSAEQDLAVYRVAQESLTNVARHAGARTTDQIAELLTIGRGRSSATARTSSPSSGCAIASSSRAGRSATA